MSAIGLIFFTQSDTLYFCCQIESVSGKSMALSEVIFRVPFLVLLEWFLCVDITNYNDWTPYARLMQLLGKFYHIFISFYVFSKDLMPWCR